MDFSPKCYLFSECNSDRIVQNIQNEVLLERIIFEEVVVYEFMPCEQRPFNLKKRCVTRQNRNNTRALNESSFETQKPSLEFRETSIFYIRHSKGFWETIYFSRNITRTTRMYRESTEQLHLRVKVLGEKKDQRNVFICKFGKLSQYFCTKFIFWTINFELFIFCEGLYLCAFHVTA